MTKIGHASSDEKGKYSGGIAGDQTGQEVCIRDWYNRPWNIVMWAEDPAIREQMALAMEQACANDNIGYDQGTKGSQDRYSLYKALQKTNFKMSAIKTKCETDCSNLVACCANCAGVQISPYIYTGNERQAFKQAKDETGKVINFIIKTESKYLTSPDNNPRGAILLYEGHHTAIQTQNGKNWVDASTKAKPIEHNVTGKLKIVGTTSLALRDYPCTDNKLSHIKASAAKGEVIEVVAKANMGGIFWFKLSTGYWCSSKYVEGLLTEVDQNNKKWIVHQGYSYKKGVIETFEGKSYCINNSGWIITPDQMNKDGSLK